MDFKAIEELLSLVEKKRTELRAVPYLELRTQLDDLKDAIDEVEALSERLDRAHDKVEEIVLDMEEAETEFMYDDDYDGDDEDDE